MQHLAIIMDGNRRWGKKLGLDATSSHKRGKDTARLAVEFCVKNKIKYLSLYTFSIENFKRSQDEQDEIFHLIVDGVTRELEEFIKQGVRIRFVGDRTLFPKNILPAIDNAEQKTKDLNTLQVNVLFCYGAQQELLHAVKDIAKQVKEGKLSLDEIDSNKFEDSLWTSGIPNPDLIIRTSGIARLSNFLLYQAAYSELAFIDPCWPDVTEADLEKCIVEFNKSKRNFGQ